MFHVEPHLMCICIGNTGQLQRHFILSKDTFKKKKKRYVRDDHPKSFHELMLITPAVPTPITTRIGSKVMEILSPSILFKMTAW